MLALRAHQDVRVTDELDAVRIDRHAGLPVATGTQIEPRQHVGDRPAEPSASRCGDHDVLVVGQRSENHIVIVGLYGDLALRGRHIALEQQIFEGALQARHLLTQPLAAVFLRSALGLRHVIEKIHGRERRGEDQQDQRHRELK